MHTVPGLFDRLTALYAEGEAAVDEGRLEDAVRIFSEGIQLDDHFRQRYVTMYAQRGFAKQRLNDLEGAIPDYTRAIEMEPPINQAQYYFHRGMCFAGLGGHEEHALADYARSSAIYPDHPGPYHLGGKLLVDAERFADAIAMFDKFLAMNAHPEVLQLRGFSKLNLGRGADAIPDLLESKRLAPDVYTDYLLAWAGAVAPNDAVFYQALEDTLRGDASYQQFFTSHEDFARFRGQPRFEKLVRG